MFKKYSIEEERLLKSYEYYSEKDLLILILSELQFQSEKLSEIHRSLIK